ncbi:dual specificity protein phosphatase 2-like [Liolophura sinensis]|uniref:dual specificity protein phosphatase 2-like n=1 Tax=Liolophura sinensis TaxID=3198878 RepID=UPI0031590539
MDGATASSPHSGPSMDIQQICSQNLVRHIQQASQGSPRCNILILDCRPFLVYNNLHVLGARNSMIPPIVKRRSRGTVALPTLLPSEEHRNRLISGHYHLVVVYDEDSEELESISQQSNLGIVLRSLRCHVDGKALRFLQGGFTHFRQMYPEMCASKSSLCKEFETTVRISKDETYAKHVEETGPAEVMSYLYLGDSRHAAQKSVLKNLGVTAIVNVSKTLVNHFPEDFVYKTIPVDDKTDTELAPWFNETISFIDEQRERGGKVLVHCQAGVSRSATICMAYIMYKRKCPMDEAFDRIHKQRGVVSPNLSFMRQLQTFEQKLDLVEPSPARSPVRPLPSPCRIASNTGFWSPSEEGYRCGLSVGSLVSPLSPTSPFLSSPLLSPI